MKAHLLLEFRRNKKIEQVSRNVNIRSTKTILDDIIIKVLRKNKRNLPDLKQAIITSPKGKFIYSIVESHKRKGVK